MKAIVTALCLAASCAAGQAWAGEPPVLGDAWVYHWSTRELDDPSAKPTSGTAFATASYRNTMDKLVFTGTGLFGMGMVHDTCLFDVAAGEELAGAVPCDAPLPVGSTWHGKVSTRGEVVDASLTVIGMERIDVGSHVYLATILRGERRMTGLDLAYQGGKGQSRHGTYWYVPEVKGMAKIVGELLNEHGEPILRETYTMLQFFRAADSAENDPPR